MSTSELGYSKASYYPPTFSGKKEDFPFYRKKMESYLAYVDCGVLMTEEGSQVKRDNHTWAENTSEEVIEKDKALMKKNRKAAGIVLNSILVDTEKGKAAFALVESFHNADDGFAGGHFKEEWDALCEWYEDVEADDVDLIEKDDDVLPEGQHERKCRIAHKINFVTNQSTIVKRRKHQ